MFTTILFFVFYFKIVSSAVYHPTKAVVTLSSTAGVSGQINFQQADTYGPVKITGTITGLTVGTHGFHVHQYGDMSNGCTSAGSHFNPMSYFHSGPTNVTRHVGDLGNIVADSTGQVTLDKTDMIISLSGKNSILGRAVVVHAAADDLGLGGNTDSLSTGNAGSRVACGTIALAEEVVVTPPVVNSNTNKQKWK